MGERILDQVENLAIKFGRLAFHDDVYLLGEVLPSVAHDAGKLHDAVLQFGRDAGEPLKRRLELAVCGGAQHPHQLVTREDEFGDHGLHRLQNIGIDADGAGARAGLAVIVVVDGGGCGGLGFADFGAVSGTEGGFEIGERDFAGGR